MYINPTWFAPALVILTWLVLSELRSVNHTGPTQGSVHISRQSIHWSFPQSNPWLGGPLSRGSRYDCARADLCHRLTSIYASSEAIFTHPTFHLHLLPPREARGAFQIIFRFRYCSLVAGIQHATYVYMGIRRNRALFLISAPGAARTRLFFGGVWPGT